MSDQTQDAQAGYTVIEGFRCYAPALAGDYADYPSDGFDLTARLEARSFWCRTRNRVLVEVFKRFTSRDRLVDVLEIGCGTGTVLHALQDLRHLRLTGSEIYLQGLKFARKRLPDVEFIQLDASEIPFRDSYDAVGAFDVLEHIDADEAVMRQVHSALRADGLFIITVPQYQWMWSRLDELVHHKRRYSRRELRTKLQAAGFDVLYSTSFVTTLFPFMMASRLLDRMRPARPTAEAQAELESQVTLPGPVNTLFDWLMRIDETFLSMGLSLPFGGSLLMVARKRLPQS